MYITTFTCSNTDTNHLILVLSLLQSRVTEKNVHPVMMMMTGSKEKRSGATKVPAVVGMLVVWNSMFSRVLSLHVFIKNLGLFLHNANKMFTFGSLMYSASAESVFQ